MHRVLLQPPFIALADGLDNRWTPASRELHVKGVHQTHRAKPIIELGLGHRLASAVYLSSTLSGQLGSLAAYTTL